MIIKYNKSNKISINSTKNLSNMKMILRKKLSNTMSPSAASRKGWRHSRYSKNMRKGFVIVVDLTLPPTSCFARKKLLSELVIPNPDK